MAKKDDRMAAEDRKDGTEAGMRAGDGDMGEAENAAEQAAGDECVGAQAAGAEDEAAGTDVQVAGDGCMGAQDAGAESETADTGKRQKLHMIWNGIGVLLRLLAPFVMYGVFEWLTGNLENIGGGALYWNLFLFFVLYLAAWGVTGAPRLSYTVLNAAFTVWALAEYFVVEFRSRPIMLMDVMAFRTAATVAGNYRYDVTEHMVQGVAVILVLTVLLWIFPVKRKKPGKLRRLLEAAASAAACVGSVVVFYEFGIDSAGISINMWEPLGSYETQGCLLSTIYSFRFLRAKKPDDYSVEAAEAIREEIEETKAEAVLPFAADTDIVPENIICIMNESFSDLRKVADFETDVPFLEFYDSLSENCVKGDLYMPVFGAMTCNSEFEFLTGNSLAFAPEGSVPFQVYMREPSWSIVSILKDEGYRTVGIHPNERTNWNRSGAYKAMGFDEFYGIESFDQVNAPRVRGQIADRADYEKIMALTEAKEEGEPLFIFDVTMQNHGGYEVEWEPTVHLTDYENFPQAEQYLSLIRESDQALEELIEYYSQVEEPTMIVLFGDHQPAVEEEFYEALYGGPLKEQEYQDLIRRHITPFLIWTNYPTESMTGVSMSAQFLSGAALQRANIELTDYQYFLNAMYQVTPVVHFYGYMKDDGILIDWNGWREKEEYPMFKDFAILQYNNMFDKKRIDGIFRNAKDGG